MSRRTEGDRGSAEPSKEGFRNAQRLASKLQRMVNTGHASPSVLQQVDQYINRRLLEETSNTLISVDSLMRKAPRVELKEELGQIYLSMMDLLNEFKSTKGRAYRNLVKKDGYVNPQRLNNLIDIDSELTSALSKLNDALQKVDRGLLTLSDCDDLRQLVDDIFVIVSTRRRMLR